MPLDTHGRVTLRTHSQFDIPSSAIAPSREQHRHLPERIMVVVANGQKMTITVTPDGL